MGESAAHLSDADTLVWYVAYGSNLRWSRFRCYLAGGRPDGSSHTNVGARNPADPLSVEPVNILGRVLFSDHSTVWGGGIAFFDPAATDLVAGRAYLITLEQFNDVVVQENGFSAGIDLALRPVLSGVELTLPDAWYGTVLRVGTMAARPMVTITSRAPNLTPTTPSPAYLWTIATGLRESHAWAPPHIAAYLETLAGVTGHWTGPQIETLIGLAAAPTGPAPSRERSGESR